MTFYCKAHLIYLHYKDFSDNKIILLFLKIHIILTPVSHMYKSTAFLIKTVRTKSIYMLSLQYLSARNKKDLFLSMYFLPFLFFSLSKKAKAAADVEYPAYGVTGPSMDSSGDRKLAHSAHIYHYQHQKQQIMAMEK